MSAGQIVMHLNLAGQAAGLGNFGDELELLSSNGFDISFYEYNISSLLKNAREEGDFLAEFVTNDIMDIFNNGDSDDIKLIILPNIVNSNSGISQVTKMINFDGNEISRLAKSISMECQNVYELNKLIDKSGNVEMYGLIIDQYVYDFVRSKGVIGEGEMLNPSMVREIRSYMSGGALGGSARCHRNSRNSGHCHRN